MQTPTTVTLTLSGRVAIAKRMTAESAGVRNWRIRNSHGREMRSIARELTASKGYIVASEREMSRRFGSLFLFFENEEADRKRVWGIQYNNLWRKLQFVAV